MINNIDDNIVAVSTPSIAEAGKTGDWRDMKPVVDNTKCIPAIKNKRVCFLCWLYCPDGLILSEIPIKIDYEYCKGCGICATECPSGAIDMVSEVKES